MASITDIIPGLVPSQHAGANAFSQQTYLPGGYSMPAGMTMTPAQKAAYDAWFSGGGALQTTPWQYPTAGGRPYAPTGGGGGGGGPVTPTQRNVVSGPLTPPRTATGPSSPQVAVQPTGMANTQNLLLGGTGAGAGTGLTGPMQNTNLAGQMQQAENDRLQRELGRFLQPSTGQKYPGGASTPLLGLRGQPTTTPTSSILIPPGGAQTQPQPGQVPGWHFTNNPQTGQMQQPGGTPTQGFGLRARNQGMVPGNPAPWDARYRR